MVSSLCSWVQFTNFSKPRPLKEAPPTKEKPPAVSTVGFLHVWIQLRHQILGFAGLEPSQLSDKQMDQTLEDLLQESEAEFGHNLTQLKTMKAGVVKLHDDGLECASTLLSMDKDLYQKISQDIEKKMSTLKVFTDTKLRPELVRFNLWETKKFALDVEKEIRATSDLITECKQHDAILTTFLKHWRGVAGM